MLTMSTVITAVYEEGVLRPLEPLPLPEHTRVQIEIVREIPVLEERERVRQALLEAGIAKARASVSATKSVSDSELRAAAERMGKTTTLSDLVIAEREGR
jgi:predicted DNA-binding antitoxin AbrB/MazE fold protein